VSLSPAEYQPLSDQDRYTRNWDLLAELLARGHSMSARERNCCFLNLGDKEPGFANVSSTTALDHPDDSRGLGIVDWDHDGDLDVWMSNRTGPRVRLLKNEIGNRQPSLAVQLEGRQCNRDAIGARLELILGGATPRKLIKTVRAGESFISQSSKWVHFGLGTNPTIKSLRVRWPGQTDFHELTGIRPNQRYHIVQGSAPIIVPPPARQLALQGSIPELPSPTDRMRLLLQYRKDLPPLSYQNLNGNRQLFRPNGKAVLVNLWASWCRPCLVELQEFAKHYESLRASGIDILALSVDGLGDDTSSRDAAHSLAQRAAWPFPTGFAESKTVDMLTRLDNTTLYFQRSLPVPTSFLIDSEGRVAGIYKGAVSSEQLLHDVRLLESPGPEFEQAAFPFPGRNGLRQFSLHPLSFAAAYLEGGYLEDAKSQVVQFLAKLDHKSDDHPTTNAQQRRKERIRAYQLMAVIARLDSDRLQEIAAFRELDKVDELTPAMVARYAVLLVAVNRSHEALARIEKLRTREAESADVQNLTAGTYFQIGRIDLAVDAYRRAVAMDEQNTEYRFNLATALQASGKTPAAIQEYQEVLRQSPELTAAANNLAWILATHPDDGIRDPSTALSLAQRASATSKHQDPAFLDTLAVASAATGNFADAISYSEQAIQLYEARQNSAATGVRERLEMYKRQKPYLAP
jgi:tetratricopeptide (TPR) repeat protein/thiol-disulfide isomerase/thioredoxin